jgi:potassium channel subfamily K, other eukaryote
VKEIGSEKVIQHRLEKNRVRTMDRSVSTPLEMKQRVRHHFHIHHAHHRQLQEDGNLHQVSEAHPEISAPTNPVPIRHIRVEAPEDLMTRGASVVPPSSVEEKARPKSRTRVQKARHLISLAVGRGPRANIIFLKEEKDRFEAMRDIQRATAAFKRYSALTFSTLSFLIVWCVGAVVFWQCEKDVQNMSYFRALYFGYVCLLTIGSLHLGYEISIGHDR